ncbi:hypothetical protein RRG08_042288 [Elysia crispata]|uniref:Uncharacterized protein n=1 Tax=Elysia crispata TaxID=231223 RepID=A0AAE1AHK2_9GAST|nr:hypothetical protein RRG08_042288 [Elysia crispata]
MKEIVGNFLYSPIVETKRERVTSYRFSPALSAARSVFKINYCMSPVGRELSTPPGDSSWRGIPQHFYSSR